jgi:hypothetical protein
MTDINEWPELVQKVEIRKKNSDGKYSDYLYWIPYVTLPFSEYQMGNLLAALETAKNTGDWWDEIIGMIEVAMEKANIKELRSNTGKLFTLESLRSCRYDTVTKQYILSVQDNKDIIPTDSQYADVMKEND